MRKITAKSGRIDDTVKLATIIRSETPEIVEEITIRRYKQMLAAKPPDKTGIAEMVYHRFYGRYVKPYLLEDERYKKFYKHGFAMMASSCLLIEAMEAFKDGLDKTPRGENQQAFDSFFKSQPAFRQFEATEFYRNVRCGILHQGETTGGYTVDRDPGSPLFDKGQKRINATKFLITLEKSLLAYQNQLLTSEWDSAIWDNFRRKMRFIIDNCEQK